MLSGEQMCGLSLLAPMEPLIPLKVIRELQILLAWQQEELTKAQTSLLLGLALNPRDELVDLLAHHANMGLRWWKEWRASHPPGAAAAPAESPDPPGSCSGGAAGVLPE